MSRWNQTPTPEDKCLIKARKALMKGCGAFDQDKAFDCLWESVACLVEAAELHSGIEPGEAFKRAVAEEKRPDNG